MIDEEIFNLTRAFFSTIDCGNCNNMHTDNSIACSYCSNQDQHNLLWNVSAAYAEQFTREVIKVVNDEENTY